MQKPMRLIIIAIASSVLALSHDKVVIKMTVNAENRLAVLEIQFQPIF
jgi:hypothetical protein